jgi:WXG100 family type VII secretion target
VSNVSDLKINYSETINVGNQVTSKGADFKELLNRVKNTNNELKTYWEGSDASKYSSSVEQQAEYMQKLADTITEIGDFLVKIGNAYQEACENNTSAIN